MDSDTPATNLPYLVLASLERRIEELLTLAERMGDHLIMYPAVFTIGQAEKWKEEALSLAAQAEAARKKGPPYHVAPNQALPTRDDTRPADSSFRGNLTPNNSYPWSGSLPTTPIPETTQDHQADTDLAGYLAPTQDSVLSDRAPGLDVSR